MLSSVIGEENPSQRALTNHVEDVVFKLVELVFLVFFQQVVPEIRASLLVGKARLACLTVAQNTRRL